MGQRLKTALENFQKAWEELDKAWDEAGCMETPDYPFESSFNDYDVPTWIDSFKELVDDIDRYSQFKLITENPDVNEIENLDLRSAFEANNVVGTNLKPCGYVGNRPADFIGEEHEDDTWAIDQYDDECENVIESFLYTSVYEYLKDCKYLGLITD